MFVERYRSPVSPKILGEHARSGRGVMNAVSIGSDRLTKEFMYKSRSRSFPSGSLGVRWFLLAPNRYSRWHRIPIDRSFVLLIPITSSERMQTGRVLTVVLKHMYSRVKLRQGRRCVMPPNTLTMRLYQDRNGVRYHQGASFVHNRRV